MGLTPGTRFGAYEVLALIGSGGMGEVYRARDTKLDRDVAIKVLPDLFVADAERIARFQREAKTLAALNHPHIAAIYGFEESNGTAALILELVEGPTLADRIAQGPIPLDEALTIARQIAEALEAAHEHGIVHRDLKPANIKARQDGTVKVLDFGLAKAMGPVGTAPDVSQSPTITTPAMMTGVGVLLGTAAYMSPEQARGRAADKRSDVWAFGCVLYEMLAAARAFEGDDVSDMLAAVLRGEPNWTALPAGTPPPIRRLLRRCLTKDRARRLDSAADARLEIEEALTAPWVVDGGAALSGPASRTRFVAAASMAFLVVAAVAALATWVARRSAPAPTPDLMRFTLPLPAGQVLGITSPDRDLVIAPDGRHLVYQEGSTGASSQLVVRAIDQLETVRLRGPAGARWPFISPDSHWIGFFAQGPGGSQGGGELRKVSMTGGPPITVCRVQAALTGASWGPDDTIIFTTSDPTTGLLSVPAGGGEPQVLTKPDPARDEKHHAFPSMLPDGHTVLFTIVPTRAIESAQVAVVDLKTGRTKTLIRGGSQAEYVETGHLIYAAAGTLYAVRFDLRRLEVLGGPAPVVERVLTKASGAADFSVSRRGTLVHVPAGARNTERQLVWVDRSGHEEPIDAPPRPYFVARLSPEGTRIALVVENDTARRSERAVGFLSQNDIWVWDLGRRTLQGLTGSGATWPVWTPDGKRIAFMATHDGVASVYWQPFDGAGTMERLSSGTESQAPASFSPDGAHLVVTTPPPSDLGVISLGATRTTTMLLHSPASETNAEISPDGRWLVYQSDESGRNEIYVRPFPHVETARRQVSTGGGTRPVWSRNGRELFYYVEQGMIMAVPVRLGADVALGNPQPVVRGAYASPLYIWRHYDVSADGQRFLVFKDATTADGKKATGPEILVVVNWFEELKRLVPAK